MCCRPPHGPGVRKPAGKWGDFQCDVPMILVDNVLQTMKSTSPNMRFVIVTGDTPAHDIWDQNQESVKRTTSLVMDAFQRNLGEIPVYFSIGNHESSPTNSFPFNSIPYPEHSVKWLYEFLETEYSRWIKPESLGTTFKRFGYYSSYVPSVTNLKILSLNTQMCYFFNFWIFMRFFETDPNNMFDWMIQELQASEDKNEKVFIIGVLLHLILSIFHREIMTAQLVGLHFIQKSLNAMIM